MSEQSIPEPDHGLRAKKIAKPLVDHRVGIDPFYHGRGAMPDSKLLEPYAHLVMREVKRDRLGKDGQFVTDGPMFKRAVNKGVRAYGPSHSERRVFAGVGASSFSNRARKGLVSVEDVEPDRHPTYWQQVAAGVDEWERSRAAKAAKRAAKSRAYWASR